MRMKANNRRQKKKNGPNRGCERTTLDQSNFLFLLFFLVPTRKEDQRVPSKRERRKRGRGQASSMERSLETYVGYPSYPQSSASGALGEMSTTMCIVWPNWLRTRPQAKRFTPPHVMDQTRLIIVLCFAFRGRVKRVSPILPAHRHRATLPLRTKRLSIQHVLKYDVFLASGQSKKKKNYKYRIGLFHIILRLNSHNLRGRKPQNMPPHVRFSLPMRHLYAVCPCVGLCSCMSDCCG